MLVIVSDTHGTDDPRLEGRTREAVDRAERVVHAGDFTTAAVYGAFDDRAARLTAVYGNNDSSELVERLPDVAAFEWRGRRFVVAHGHEHTETALSMLARQEDADVVVVGHSHRPAITEFGDALLVNPGSHADPRQYTPAHAEAEMDDRGEEIRVTLRRPDGATVSEVCQ
ncbi:metallophosphoesterase [Halomicrobium salinisoli]|uniref:metallophosphoesterase n=1 Tax=Halomicrobium salinisoli TaxID=2878391 RepID=UPI001CEFB233|nr:metallophosphoesterase [Halomicrobium salinisoli]